MPENIFLARITELARAAERGCRECAERLARDGSALADRAILAGADETHAEAVLDAALAQIPSGDAIDAELAELPDRVAAEPAPLTMGA